MPKGGAVPIIRAPWTNQQIVSIRTYMNESCLPPLTCAACGRILALDRRYLFCLETSCQWTRGWIPEWITNGDWAVMQSTWQGRRKARRCLASIRGRVYPMDSCA